LAGKTESATLANKIILHHFFCNRTFYIFYTTNIGTLYRTYNTSLSNRYSNWYCLCRIWWLWWWWWWWWTLSCYLFQWVTITTIQLLNLPRRILTWLWHFYHIRILVYFGSFQSHKRFSLFLILELDEGNPTCKEGHFNHFEYFNSCPNEHLIELAIVNLVFSVTD